jgi:hypothetical protein
MDLHHSHIDNLPGINKQILIALEQDLVYNNISIERCFEPSIKENAEWISIDLTNIKSPTIEPQQSDAGELVQVTLESSHAYCSIEKLELLNYIRNKKIGVIYTTNNGQKRLVKKMRLSFNSNEGETSSDGNLYKLVLTGKNKHEPQYITGIAPVISAPIIITPPIIEEPPVVEPSVLFYDDFVSGLDGVFPVNWRALGGNTSYADGIVSVQNSKALFTINGSGYGLDAEPIISKFIDVDAHNLIGKQILVEAQITGYAATNSFLSLDVSSDPYPARNYGLYFQAANLTQQSGSSLLISETSPIITNDIQNIRLGIRLSKYSINGPYPVNDFVEIDWVRISIVP